MLQIRNAMPCHRELQWFKAAAPARSSIRRGDADTLSGFRRRVRWRVLRHRIFLGQVAARFAEPVRLDVLPYFREGDRVISPDLGEINGVRHMLTLRVDADLALRGVHADVAERDHLADIFPICRLR